jgi:hypothetical protein
MSGFRLECSNVTSFNGLLVSNDGWKWGYKLENDEHARREEIDLTNRENYWDRNKSMEPYQAKETYNISINMEMLDLQVWTVGITTKQHSEKQFVTTIEDATQTVWEGEQFNEDGLRLR